MNRVVKVKGLGGEDTKVDSKMKIIWKYLSVIIIIVLSIIVLIQYKQNTDRVQYKERFVNHLYFQVDRCIDVIPEEYTNIKANEIKRIIDELNRLDSIIFDAHSFLNTKIYYNYMKNFRQIGDIIYSNGNGLDDGKISNRQIAFLGKLKKNLEDVKVKMFSENTGQENPNLSFEDINSIMNEFFDNY